MTDKPRTHYPDLIFGRPCCSAEGAPVSRDLAQVTCRRCRRIVEKCEKAEAERAGELAHG